MVGILAAEPDRGQGTVPWTRVVGFGHERRWTRAGSDPGPGEVRQRVASWLALAGLVAAALLEPGRAPAAEPPPLSLPPGFGLEVYASGLGGVRFMTLDPAGAVLVSVPGQGRVIALPDEDGDGRADRVVTVAEGLDRPHGLAFRNGHLWVAENGRVLRLVYDPRTRQAGQPAVVVPGLPPGGGHWTRTIAFGPDGRLYVSVGSSCNVCRESDPRRAAITRYNPDGSGERLFATGLRNAVGLAFHPMTGALWATVNERDWRGDDLPPDHITEVQEGGHYGWPGCFAAGGRAVPDREFPGARCRDMVLPSVEIQAHSAPLGLAFYTGRQFPPEYHGHLFVAYRGSWNRSVPTGYKVVRLPFRDGRPAGPPLDFVTGWLAGGAVRGRPVDVLVARDGALLVSDQGAGQIHRITAVPASRR
jgi:glucose/arabinose dehydrogenase